jgi:RNase H-like domain found in reverse transcriptase
MDNFWMASTGSEEGLSLHREMIHCFLMLCEKNKYYLKMSKCQIMQLQMALLGWLVTSNGLCIDPAKVTGISEWPTTLKNVKEVQKTMGVLGYQRPFIPGFVATAKIITELTKKGVPFVWTDNHCKALKALIKLVTTAPILAYPDLGKQFELEVDASAFTVGAILFQRDDKGHKRDMGYYSKALNSAERNYDIWDQEFLAVIVVLKHWRHILIGMSHKIIVWTDHQNLQYYCQLQKVNRRVAREISFMADFPLELKHIAGKRNRADPLSRRPDYDNGSHDNEGMTALPEAMFGRIIEATTLDQMVEDEQMDQSKLLKEWEMTHNLQ